MPARVFISYSSKDLAAVQALVSALQQRGIECWWDRWEINPGTDIVAARSAECWSSQTLASSFFPGIRAKAGGWRPRPAI
jgi:hypothetical protein